MNKIFKGLLVILLILSVGCCFSACSSSEDKASDLASTILEKSANVAKTAVDEYVEEVDSAGHEDVQDLKDDGNTLLQSLDDVEQAMEDGGDEISDDVKTQVSNDVTEMRQKINDAMAKLDTK